uniref:UDP-glycose: glycosyltransferase UGT71U1 n=1 Tax=Fagopyrum esculentum TaxID=3617 RepID=A0A0A1H9X0_FAGES|nr:UDP-glycose: glycosyltransferase UGT71U1 [Fagopyrum esculentum]
MKKAELVFIPSPGAGHTVSAAEFANRLIARDARISVTILTMSSPFTTAASSTSTYPNPEPSVDVPRYISLPQVQLPPIKILQDSIEEYISTFAASHSHFVRNELISLQKSPEIPVYLVVDMFCTAFIDVANELGIPSYVFFTSGSAFLGLRLNLPDLYERTGIAKFIESEPEFEIPSFRNPVPASGFPGFAFNKSGYTSFMNHARKFQETKGIMVNTFAELEPYAIKSLTEISPNKVPVVYTIGPVLNLKGAAHKPCDQDIRARIMNWLDIQPESSVVYLCFGSVGSFEEEQVKEIAKGLNQSGQRFLWSLRKRITEGAIRPTDYTDEELKSVLPDDFRTFVAEGRGMVCGWAPQVEILAHKAIGSFVTHCGWNSTLESVWFGKPIVAWPLYAEQRVNAFELVKELGLAAAWLGYGTKPGDVVTANEVESAVRSVMDKDNPVRSKVKEISEVSRLTLLDGGSSFNSIGSFIKNIIPEEL